MDRYFSDPEAIYLLLIVAASIAVIMTFGDILLPVFLSMAIALVLQFWVNLLDKRHLPHRVSFWIVYLIFVTLFFGALLFLLPLLWRQCVNFVAELPTLIEHGKEMFLNFVQTKHNYVSKEYLDSIASSLMLESQTWGKKAIAISLASIPGIITIAVYVILVPMLVFFFLRDYKAILKWFKGFLPGKRPLFKRIWDEMNEQVGNYIRGKIYEIIIVFVFTYAVFAFFDLPYRFLLASMVGIAVLIPYIGFVVTTIPVVLVGYFQWGGDGGLTGQFAMMLYAYLIVQFIDGNILVPVLFSEVVNLHPIAIIIAILFFGSIWGFWGVFFAIPLATFVNAIINAWPRHQHHITKT